MSQHWQLVPSWIHRDITLTGECGVPHTGWPRLMCFFGKCAWLPAGCSGLFPALSFPWQVWSKANYLGTSQCSKHYLKRNPSECLWWGTWACLRCALGRWYTPGDWSSVSRDQWSSSGSWKHQSGAVLRAGGTQKVWTNLRDRHPVLGRRKRCGGRYYWAVRCRWDSILFEAGPESWKGSLYSFCQALENTLFSQEKNFLEGLAHYLPFHEPCYSLVLHRTKPDMQKHHEKMQLENSWHDLACGSSEMGNLIGFQTCSADSWSGSSWISIWTFVCLSELNSNSKLFQSLPSNG